MRCGLANRVVSASTKRMPQRFGPSLRKKIVHGDNRAPLDRKYYSSRILASLMTLPMLVISDFMVAANCSGELPTGSTPKL